MIEKPTVAIDIDDASVIRTKYHLIRQLLERYPNLKITLFFTPFDVESETMQVIKIYRDRRLKELHELIDTGCLEIVPHGLSHLQDEFKNADKYTVRLAMRAVDEILTKDRIPYVRGFKAPFWLYNKNLVDFIDKNDWWLAVNRDEPNALKSKKFYIYNYSIDEPFWSSGSKIWKLHGHMNGTNNDFEDNFLNLLKIPLESDFKFASELLETD